MIELTPLDVRKKKGDFRRGLRGYESPQVDDFLDVVADRLEALVRENQAFADRVTRLEQQVADYREREKALTEALVTAQEMREEMRAQVAREAELSRRSAEQDAERIRAGAVQARDREEDTLRRLRGRQLHFLQTYRAFLEKELAELASMAVGLELNESIADPLAAGASGTAPAAAPAPPPAGTASAPKTAAPAAATPPPKSGPPRSAESWEEWGLEPPRPSASAAPPAGRPVRRGGGPSGPPAGTVPAGAAKPAAPAGPRPERSAFAAGVAGASVARGEAPQRGAAGSPPSPPKRPKPRAAQAPAAPPAAEPPEAELILSDADVLAEPDPNEEFAGTVGGEANLAAGAGAASSPPRPPGDAEPAGLPPQKQSFFPGDLSLPDSDIAPGHPSGAAGAGNGDLELDLVPEFEEFGEFGDLADDLDEAAFGLTPEPPRPDQTTGPSADAEKRRDDPNDDPEDLLSTLFGDDR